LLLLAIVFAEGPQEPPGQEIIKRRKEGVRMKRRSAFAALILFTVNLFAAETYAPPPESAGGWRACQNDEEVRSLAGMDPQRLNLIRDQQLQVFQGPWSIVIIRHGYLVAEWFGVPTMPHTTFDVWSCTKSATGVAFGLLLDDSLHHKLLHDVQISLDTPVYDFVPEGRPLTDPEKKKIDLRHLLTMTSGIPGESRGVMGLAVAPRSGEYELALGKEPNRFGISAAKLTGEPGTVWDYSDAAFAHLSLFFAHAAGREIDDYMKERVFDPIGMEDVSWDRQGGSGHIGPHTNAHSGLHLSARDFARLGYLLAHDGRWRDMQIVPRSWIQTATQSSQKLNPSYGYTFWVNTDAVLWPTVPRDAFAFRGYGANRCYVVPSLDLVVVRVGDAPPNWGEESLLPAVMAAVLNPPSSKRD
jgi:CubicO group peptidase (beta-lactamase class C family)